MRCDYGVLLYYPAIASHKYTNKFCLHINSAFNVMSDCAFVAALVCYRQVPGFWWSVIVRSRIFRHRCVLLCVLVHRCLNGTAPSYLAQRQSGRRSQWTSLRPSTWLPSSEYFNVDSDYTVHTAHYAGRVTEPSRWLRLMHGTLFRHLFVLRRRCSNFAATRRLHYSSCHTSQLNYQPCDTCNVNFVKYHLNLHINVTLRYECVINVRFTQRCQQHVANPWTGDRKICHPTKSCPRHNMSVYRMTVVSAVDVRYQLALLW